MTIPRKQAFDDCLEIIDNGVDPEILQLFRPEDFGEASTRGWELARKAVEIRWQKVDSVARQEAMIWLSSQSAYMHAEKRVHADFYRTYGTSEPTLRESTDALMRRFLQAVANGKNFRSVVRYSLNPGFIWHRGIIEALREYFYTDTAKSLATARRKFESTLQTAIAGMKALQSIADDPVASDVLKSLPEHHRPRFFTPKLLATQLSGLEVLSSLDPDDLYPIARADATAAERLFVYRMCRLNTKLFRSAKAEAIANLMLLEGFKESIDTRNIEKMCQKIVGKRRQLYTEIGILTAGESIDNKDKSKDGSSSVVLGLLSAVTEKEA